MGAHPRFSTLRRRGLNPIKLAYSPSPPDNGLGQYVSSPGNRAYCHAELAVTRSNYGNLADEEIKVSGAVVIAVTAL